MVNAWEVGDDDGDGEGDDQDAGQGADASDQFSQHRVRNHVAVTENNKEYKCKETFKNHSQVYTLH